MEQYDSIHTMDTMASLMEVLEGSQKLAIPTSLAFDRSIYTCHQVFAPPTLDTFCVTVLMTCLLSPKLIFYQILALPVLLACSKIWESCWHPPPQ